MIAILFPLLGAVWTWGGRSFALPPALRVGACVCVGISAVLFMLTPVSPHPSFDESHACFSLHGIPWSAEYTPLTAPFLKLISMVSLAVHIYALAYMKNESRHTQFMGLLSLFTFFMMLLVSAAHWTQFFMGWEGVGLSSYLLIGFWFEKPKAQHAAFKAFLINRVADVGLIVAICQLYAVTHHLTLDQSIQAFPTLTPFEQKVVAWGLMAGVMGKSAQWGFHVWLPDAMEGPTPVSALIHAATMVTAGVFMIFRLFPLFTALTWITDFMVIIGTVTLVGSGLLACGQKDLKRLLAYSTCSQLGLMVLTCGVLSRDASFLHLIVHGFFKAALFLGAGCVIHAAGHHQHLESMKGMIRTHPWIVGAMILATGHLLGLPGFMGHTSKAAILQRLYPFFHIHDALWGWHTILLGFFCTGFYSSKMILSFLGPKPSTPSSISISPCMGLPVLALSLGAWAAPALFSFPLSLSATLYPQANQQALLCTSAGIVLAWIFHTFPFLFQTLRAFWNRACQHGWGWDHAYHVVFTRPFQKSASHARLRDTSLHQTLIASGIGLFPRKGRYIFDTHGEDLEKHLALVLVGLILGIAMMLEVL